MPLESHSLHRLENVKPSPHRSDNPRPEDGDGKCAVQINVDVSHRQLNSSRRDAPACGEL